MAWPMAAGDSDSGTASHSDRYDSTRLHFLISSYRDKGISGGRVSRGIMTTGTVVFQHGINLEFPGSYPADRGYGTIK